MDDGAHEARLMALEADYRDLAAQVRSNREKEVEEHTAIRESIVAMGEALSTRLWQVGAAVIVSALTAAAAQVLGS